MKRSSARVSVLGYRVDLVSMTPRTFAVCAIEGKRKKSIERGGKEKENPKTEQQRTAVPEKP